MTAEKTLRELTPFELDLVAGGKGEGGDKPGHTEHGKEDSSPGRGKGK
jgi:hypothetical protein